MTQDAKAPLPLGHSISYSPRDGIVITLQHVRRNTYSVLTMAGATRLDDWSRSYADEHTARGEARRVAVLFRAYDRNETIEERRTKLEFRVRDLLNSRRPQALCMLDDVEAELDELATLADRAAYVKACAEAQTRGFFNE